MKSKNIFCAIGTIFAIVAMAAGVAYAIYVFMNRRREFCEDNYIDCDCYDDCCCEDCCDDDDVESEDSAE